MTDIAAKNFVVDKFDNVPGLAETFNKTVDAILRADFLRYLMIFSEGGVYTDIDTECTRPIDKLLGHQMSTWVTQTAS